jgi:hypothetical protein
LQIHLVACWIFPGNDKCMPHQGAKLTKTQVTHLVKAMNWARLGYKKTKAGQISCDYGISYAYGIIRVYLQPLCCYGIWRADYIMLMPGYGRAGVTAETARSLFAAVSERLMAWKDRGEYR